MLQVIPEWLMYTQIMVIIFFRQQHDAVKSTQPMQTESFIPNSEAPVLFVALTGAIYRLVSVPEVRKSVLKWTWSWPSSSFYIVGDTENEDLVIPCDRAMPGAAEGILRTLRMLTETIPGLVKASRSMWWLPVILLLINTCRAVCQPPYEHYFI